MGGELVNQRPSVADLFDALAETYDAVGVSFFGPIAEGLVEALGPAPGEQALDIGCGRGAALLPLARAVTPTGRAVGIDISPRMVELARFAADAAGVTAQIEVGDAMEPPVEPGSFDIVTASLVLFFLPDPAAALARWRTLLNDTGRLGVSSFGPYDERWRDSVDAALQAHAPEAVRDARTSGARGPFSSDAGMEALLRDAGFHDVRTVSSSVSPRFDDAEHWYRWSMSVGQRQFWMAIPPDAVDRVKADVFTAVEACRDESGAIGFDQQIRYTLGTA